MPADVDIAFDLELEHGRCVGVRLAPGDEAIDLLAARALLPEERAAMESMSAARRRGWVGGRAAMRQALARAGLPEAPVLSDARGAPLLVPGVAGSISHKESLAVALVAREQTARVGVDVELDVPPRIDIAPAVLTGPEAEALAGLDSRERSAQVLLHFCAKEAIYKALDPFVRRYVGFREVGLLLLPGGGATVDMGLRDGEGPFVVDVRWRRIEGLVLTTARVMVHD